jgi:hypothetical protein
MPLETSRAKKNSLSQVLKVSSCGLMLFAAGLVNRRWAGT